MFTFGAYLGYGYTSRAGAIVLYVPDLYGHATLDLCDESIAAIFQGFVVHHGYHHFPLHCTEYDMRCDFKLPEPGFEPDYEYDFDQDDDYYGEAQ